MKRQLALALVPALLALASIPAWGSDGDIVMFSSLVGTADQQGYECTSWRIKHNNGQGSQPFGSCQPPVLTVYADLKGASADGITGVEWAIELRPTNSATIPGYFVLPVPIHGASLQLGSAFLSQPRGENLSWDVCKTGDMNGRIPLYQVFIFSQAPCGPSQQPPQLEMVAGAHSSPGNIYFRCPLFTLCDGPTYTKVCLGDNLTLCKTMVPPFPIASTCSSSGEFSINTPGSGVGQCTPPPGKVAAAAAIAKESSWGSVKALYR